MSFKLDEFCRSERCIHHNSIENSQMHVNLNNTYKSASDKRIKEIKEKYCKNCKAHKFYIYLSKNSYI